MPNSTRGRQGAHQVKCDQPTGPCAQCKRMGLKCTGLSEESVTPQERHAIVNDAFRHAGRHRRAVGACHECQMSKMRCNRGKPRCERCTSKSIHCTYPYEYGRRRRAEAETREALQPSAIALSPQLQAMGNASNIEWLVDRQHVNARDVLMFI
ncbi:hypothetical protein N7462_001400 [Penicillium macrosclerotiorum]|uniref:uncharacterized protein n=1 Tax=Penicillium macrosclerotiorum TaxID=303699 RepID=UPI0025493384|nr:uncharacterized protein N7462_001400 [Penicillium macrosclerotiorum]KAJ5691977.1 hypothetical protein N7462_001400 [Penicillium macrosclerotiorum]